VKKSEQNGAAVVQTPAAPIVGHARPEQQYEHKGGLFGLVRAIVRARCPRCWKGRIFRGSVTMNDPCPVCGLIFQREEGYFLGAMYCSYLISSVVLGVLYFVCAALLPNLRGEVLVLVALVPFFPLVPAVFRYSRVLWIYVERAGSPLDDSAGAYEKLRLKRQREQGDGHRTSE
jgi:uncharacterized protein (DUF983 family)